MEEEEYGERVQYLLALPEENTGDLSDAIAGITKSLGLIRPV